MIVDSPQVANVPLLRPVEPGRAAVGCVCGLDLSRDPGLRGVLSCNGCLP